MVKSRLNQLLLLIALWLGGLALFFILGLWNVYENEKDTENRLLGDAGRIAAQLASLLTLPENASDGLHIRGIVSGAMEDENIYAVKVEYKSGLHEGRRRNYLWEPILWDDEIAENCIQGMTPLKKDGKIIGVVEIWLSPRQINEEERRIFLYESIRFVIISLFWTLSLWILLKCGISLKRIKRQLGERLGRDESPRKEDESGPLLGLAQGSAQNELNIAADICNQDAGRRYQRKNPDSWLIFAGLFRQTFAKAPELMNKLYAGNDLASLCHLGRMMEKAAPCLGSGRLLEAAKHMQSRLNDPDSSDKASSVENCARILQDVLTSLKR